METALTISGESQTRSDSSRTQLISTWLFKFALAFQAQGKEPAINSETAPMLAALWSEALEDVPSEALEPVFKATLRSCKWFPTVADIRSHIESGEDSRAEEEWQNVLEYCRQWVNRDVPMHGPALPADIAHAARAAGGVYYLESCSEHDLIFAKQRFIEDLTRQRKTGDIAGFLPRSELRELLEAAAPRFALPETSENTPARWAEHSESVPRPLLRKVERAANLTAMIRQGEALWRASHGHPVAQADGASKKT